MKKLIAILLAAVMVLTVAACSNPENEINSMLDELDGLIDDMNELLDDLDGIFNQDGEIDSVPFGGYDWIVLDERDGKALMIFAQIMDSVFKYDNSQFDVTWESSDVRAYLNGEFYFDMGEQYMARIAPTRVINDDNPWYSTPAGNDTDDFIFLLSIDEVLEYFGDSGRFSNGPGEENYYGYFSDEYDAARITPYRGVTTSGTGGVPWWLRSPGQYANHVAIIDYDGQIHVGGNTAGAFFGGGLRPAMWVYTDGTTRDVSGEELQINEIRTLQFGGLDWLVLDEQDGNALIISENVLEIRPLSAQISWENWAEDVVWGNSELREYLNGEFYESFDENDRARIIETAVSDSVNPWIENNEADKTDDFIFILGLQEVIRYFGDSGLFPYDEPEDSWTGFNDKFGDARFAHMADAEWPRIDWWIRTLGKWDNNFAYIGGEGSIHLQGDNYYSEKGVRPVMWIVLEN
jgi:hypothetical protein